MKVHDRGTTHTHATVGVGEIVYLNNFIMEDGLDSMYQGPYQVLDPNVKFDKDNEKIRGCT